MANVEVMKMVDNMFCKNHTGKMETIFSISTLCDINPNCVARMMNGNLICAKCFSHRMGQRMPGLVNKLKRNTEILTTTIIDVDDIPVLMNDMLRGESFGDLNNEIQVVNYFNIFAKNAHARCALWTKNPWIIASAMEKYSIKKPDNLVIVYSTPELNGEPNTEIFAKYPFVDKIFTVYDKTHAKEINCGARSCRTCGRCYSKDTERIINEMLK